jgi:heme-degrading monooxygenase HmoA
MSSQPDCHAFSIMLSSDQLPELLRRVAAHIETIEGFELLNIVVDEANEEVTASVYYWVDEADQS